MSNPTVKTRIQLKNDTEANWNKAINFVPLRGELIVYSTDEAHPFFRLKMGDGVTTVTELPFVDASTVTGFTVGIDVPADAVFTDTTVEMIDICPSI